MYHYFISNEKIVGFCGAVHADVFIYLDVKIKSIKILDENGPFPN